MSLYYSVALAIVLAYAVIKRYRTATSVTPPSPLELWLATKPTSTLRIIGITVLLVSTVAYYFAWQADRDTRAIFQLLSFTALLSLALIHDPERWLDEAYFYNEDPKEWERVKRAAVGDLKSNYWRLQLQRLAVVALLVLVFFWLL